MADKADQQEALKLVRVLGGAVVKKGRMMETQAALIEIDFGENSALEELAIWHQRLADEQNNESVETGVPVIDRERPKVVLPDQ